MNYNCNCSRTNYLDHNYTYWENRQITSDEFEIINFLENSFDLNSKCILHIESEFPFLQKNFLKIKYLELLFLEKKLIWLIL